MTIQDQIKKHDNMDSLSHSPESRMFATILFADRPEDKVSILDEVSDKKLSIMGRKVKAEIMDLREKGKATNLWIQDVFVGKRYKGIPLSWFFACMMAAPSTISHPFHPAEIGVVYD